MRYLQSPGRQRVPSTLLRPDHLRDVYVSASHIKYTTTSNTKIGQSTLPSSCPVCEHTPVSAEDCKPNKALRTTIKIFLRTEEKKREALRQKEVKNTPPATPLEPEPTPVEPVAAPEPIVEEIQAPTAQIVDETPQVDGTLTDQVDGETTDKAQQDIPQASIEVR